MDVFVEAGSSSEAVPDGVGLEMCGIATYFLMSGLNYTPCSAKT